MWLFMRGAAGGFQMRRGRLEADHTDMEEKGGAALSLLPKKD